MTRHRLLSFAIAAMLVGSLGVASDAPDVHAAGGVVQPGTVVTFATPDGIRHDYRSTNCAAGIGCDPPCTHESGPSHGCGATLEH